MKTHEEKLSEMRAAAAVQKADRETIFARIDEAIATHRAAQKATHDHVPDCGEDLLRAFNRRHHY